VLLLGPVERSPHRLPNEEAHGVNEAVVIARESVVDAFGEGHEVPLLDLDPDPAIVLVAHIKVPAAPETVSDLFSVVNVLILNGGEEGQGKI
jgi:hypothetical protein